MDAFTNLSAISEENAAGCEQTNASVQELNETIAGVSMEADELSSISEQMVEQVAYFRV